MRFYMKLINRTLALEGGIIKIDPHNTKKKLTASNYKSPIEFIDFIFLNIKNIKKTFCRWKFSNVLLAKYYTT